MNDIVVEVEPWMSATVETDEDVGHNPDMLIG